MSPRPSKAIIGPYPYIISYDRDEINAASVDQEESLSGQCKPDKQRLLVHPDLAPEQMRATVIHECLHAMFESSGLRAAGVESNIEEAIVSSFEALLLRFIRDNGALVDWLYEEE